MIHVWYKEPGKIGKDRWIKNELHVFQQLVGGYIEVVRLQKSPDYCLMDGEDGPEFTHCNLNASQVRRMLLKEG